MPTRLPEGIYTHFKDAVCPVPGSKEKFSGPAGPSIEGEPSRTELSVSEVQMIDAEGAPSAGSSGAGGQGMEGIAPKE